MPHRRLALAAAALILTLACAPAHAAPAAHAQRFALAPLGARFRRPADARRATPRRVAPARPHALARAAAHRPPSVGAVLAAMLHGGAISEATYSHCYSVYVAAVRSLAHLGGTRREELGGVIANVKAMAATGEFTPTRLPAVFLTLERNRAWWTAEPLLSSGERVGFPGSRLVWEYYPGQGIEIQWLATFGRANGYFLSGHENASLRQLLAEVIPLAAARAGGIAWEYLFRFDGGSPPWTSGLSQGTAIQVLARAWQRLKEPGYLAAAQQALGIFETAPAVGVHVAAPAGTEYAEYTYAPADHILNGFIQALVGLYDYTQITKDPLGQQLFEAGDAEARAEVPHYDTGAWSRYDQSEESNLNYHELLAEFLAHLCQRTRKGEPYTPPAPAPAPPAATPTQPAAPPSPATGASGGSSASAAAAPAPAPVPIEGDQVYCTTSERFYADLRTPPVIALLSKRVPASARAGVQLSLSKISNVGLTIRKGARVVWRNSATVEGGHPRLLWITPANGGTFTVRLTATDLAGNFATAEGTIVVTRH